LGRLLGKFYDKLRDIAGAGDELIEKPIDSESVTPTGPEGSPELVEGEDFYWEGNCMVLTAEYLLKRGHCCESGCRHCPYGFKRR
jgi:hypothetical protein